jgi:hypothetical protein
MKPRTAAEELIADTLAKALMGQLTVGPLDMMRLASAAREVDARRIAELAIERWLSTDARAQNIFDHAIQQRSRSLISVLVPRQASQ